MAGRTPGADEGERFSVGRFRFGEASFAFEHVPDQTPGTADPDMPDTQRVLKGEPALAGHRLGGGEIAALQSDPGQPFNDVGDIGMVVPA